MFSHPRKLLTLCIATALLSARADALGVGAIELDSYLGKPLQAEIALDDTGALGLDQLKVRLGSEADYQALGVEHSYLHSQLRIEPVLRNGRSYVRITTREPVGEPYLNFVVAVQWPSGKVVREFTVLLDPAPIEFAAATPHTKTAAAMPEPSAKNSSANDRSAKTPAAKDRAATAPTAPIAIEAGADYTVQSGDSLWRIASRLRTTAPLQQTMNAIAAHNPQAFINGDPTRLKVAALIALPTEADIAATAMGLPPTQSAQDVAAIAVPAAAPDTDTAAAPEPALLAENATLKAQVADLSSSVGVLNQSLGQSEQRLRELEAQLNGVLQQIQQQRATVAALSGDAMPPAAAPVGGSSLINRVNAADLTPEAPIATPWWVHLLYWLGIGGALAWAARAHFWPQRRLAAINVPVAIGAEPQQRTAQVQAPIWGDAPALTARSAIGEMEEAEEIVAAVAEEPPALESNQFDPVDASISAGVFVAFGRFDEAERLLKDALRQAPTRVDLQLQLLDVYLQADRREQFDALAVAIEHGPTTPEILAELAVLRESYRG